MHPGHISPGDDILQGQRMTDWNDTLDTMPASNVTLYANIIAGITNTYTINFSSTVEDGMFFIADNKDEITKDMHLYYHQSIG